ncbi:MAG: alpha/beta hydrolase [Algoriphagus sp.]|uniref:alpha/beta hydrolase family protein n=1 Tax=Algoriphagus sp. TaxID=1872435 RepID=UPI00272FDF18|nr:alpha/beta fold hydrolase [Algoriphagus sp.]MDP2040356.1 alpha/beta hydrolase [Algoriphagus sp.]MDP3473841.1 alpha/beta hydrolase [Algoriphagus sp.]
MKKIILSIIISSLFQTGICQKMIYSEVSPGEEVLLPGKLNVSGSLLLPQELHGRKVPAFIFISGSGDFSYRSHFHPKADYTYSKDLSELLLARGYAVFFLEKRGINHAGGNWRNAGIKDYADDAKRVIQYLKQRPEIDTTQIGLMGHSQGGYIAQVVAAENPDDITLLINLVGPAQSVHQQILFDMHNQYSCRGLKDGKLKFKMGVLKVSLALVKTSSHFIKPMFVSHVISHDPSKYIPRIQCPILTVYAENDYMVDDISNTQLMTKLLWNSNDKHWIHTIEGVNHQFLSSELCYDWDEIDKNVHPELLSLINKWLDDVHQTYLTTNN